jgi:hypothetical protein
VEPQTLTKEANKKAFPLEPSRRINRAKRIGTKKCQKRLDAVGIEPTTFHSMLKACETKIIPLDCNLLVMVIYQQEIVLHTQAPYQIVDD